MATLAALPLDGHTLAAAACLIALAAFLVALGAFVGSRSVDKRLSDLERRQ